MINIGYSINNTNKDTIYIQQRIPFTTFNDTLYSIFNDDLASFSNPNPNPNPSTIVMPNPNPNSFMLNRILRNRVARRFFHA